MCCGTFHDFAAASRNDPASGKIQGLAEYYLLSPGQAVGTRDERADQSHLGFVERAELTVALRELGVDVARNVDQRVRS